MSRNDRVQCDRDGCDKWFVKKTHNQRYHDDECCRLATNARIMAKYYERRAQRRGELRLCRECKMTKLSRYNDSMICASCKTRKQSDANSAVLNMLVNANIVG